AAGGGCDGWWLSGLVGWVRGVGWEGDCTALGRWAARCWLGLVSAGGRGGGPVAAPSLEGTNGVREGVVGGGVVDGR
ncbi:hypothetical protein, partial [Gordonia otitidis]|uniref:hypothetical protein n=1 Tax=Gordonia otitidis TaxID=249058 RepID=UPI001C3F1BA1